MYHIINTYFDILCLKLRNMYYLCLHFNFAWRTTSYEQLLYVDSCSLPLMLIQRLINDFSNRSLCQYTHLNPHLTVKKLHHQGCTKLVLCHREV